MDGSPSSSSRLRRRTAAALAAVAVALLAVPAASTARKTATAAAIVLTGHGFGHGIGLSQWGAEERAAAGQTTAQILHFYYPGTQLAATPATNIRVLIALQPAVSVGSAAPFTVTDASGAVLPFAAGLHLVGPGLIDGQAVDFPVVVTPGSAPLNLAGTAYHGTFTLAAVQGQVQVVNTLGLEDYLVSVVSAECPGTWHAAALEAQAVASRSYALANLRPQAAFDLYPDDRSQNYHGLARYLPTAQAAVAATQGRVLLYRGGIVDALFSASNGGRTSVPQAVWSNVSMPYFAVREDAYDAKSPDTNWGPLKLSLADIRHAFPQVPALVSGVALVRNAGGRVTKLTFVGANGATVSLGGYAFQERLGLRSTFFAVEARP